ncbi:MAG: GAF domain-containing protein [Ktedonobacteraceae bacterium]|nr:GAF domain-containing protein [Ktedonobacteraceae bacterium]MBO0795542.1 GAF domain-containing protein [Ktedonobacteraceae bacterium]
MQKEQSWRELLANLPNAEKKRIVKALGIRNNTLTRWIRGHILLPHPYRLQQLIHILPLTIRARFVALLHQDPLYKHHARKLSLVPTHLEIPSTFYARILETNISVTDNLRFSAISQLALLQALDLFDPNRLGFFFTILRCTPPTDGRTVRSLYQQCAMGTPPWSTIMNQTRNFFGCESLAGQAVEQLRPIAIHDFAGYSVHPHEPQDIYAASMAACPIIRDGCVAGALLAASAQPYYFLPGHLNLLRQYSYLLVIGIDEHELYDVRHLALGTMPPIALQQEITTQLQEKLTNQVKRNPLEEHFKTWPDAEREMLHYLEEQLLTYTTSNNKQQNS